MAEVKKRSPKTPENTSREPSVPFGFEPVPSLDENSECPSAKHGKHKEMWLIKVPAEFDASSLSGKTVVLNGSQDVPLKLGSKGAKARFEILSKPISNSVPGSSKVILPSSHDESLWAAKEFVGNMSVIQSVSVPTPDSPPSPHHSSQHVQAPDITSCRWKPFGYKKPFSSTQQTKTTKKEKENKSVGDQKSTFGFSQKNRPSESHHKPEAVRSEEAKKHKEKIRIKQEKVDDEEDTCVKSKKMKTEKRSPQKEVQVKIEKKSPTKEKRRKEKEKEKEEEKEKEKEKSILSFIPLGVTVKTETLKEEEGETPRKKRKKEKRK